LPTWPPPARGRGTSRRARPPPLPCPEAVPSLDGVAAKHRLEGRADVSSARLVGDWATASVYEVDGERK